MWNSYETIPNINVPVVAVILKKSLKYCLLFYTESGFYEVDNEESFTCNINNKFYLNKGWYILYENIPIGYPVLKWKYIDEHRKI